MYDDLMLAVILQEELEKRKENNPAYSLRAFAKYLEISPAALSQMMSGKRGASTKRMNEILNRLGLSPKDQKRAMGVKDNRKIHRMEDDQFKLISEWYHFAILSLGELPECKSDPRWVARRLNIPVQTANQALYRLERLGIIEISQGKFKQIGQAIETTTDIPSGSIRSYYKQVLGLAQNKLEQVPVEKREFSSMTMAINTKNLKRAKKITQQYKEDMLALLERGKYDEVYQLSIQLFPLTNTEDE